MSVLIHYNHLVLKMHFHLNRLIALEHFVKSLYEVTGLILKTIRDSLWLNNGSLNGLFDCVFISIAAFHCILAISRGGLYGVWSISLGVGWSGHPVLRIFILRVLI